MDFKNDNLWLMQGDCLERMKEIPDNSVDLILCDPPYNGVKKLGWDNQWGSDAKFLLWFEKIIQEMSRIGKPTSATLIFCKPSIAPLLAVRINESFDFQSDIVWKKLFELKGHEGWKNKCNKMSLRRPYPSSERILYHARDSYAEVIKNARIALGLSVKELTEILGAYKNVNNGGQVSNWESGRNYPPSKFLHKLQEVLAVEVPHKRKFDATALRTFEDILEYPIVNPTTNIHTCEKPIDLLMDLIAATTNEGETVLDFTMGSGSTIKAALNLNRKAIGIEMGQCEKKNHKYCGMDWTDVIIDQLGL